MDEAVVMMMGIWMLFGIPAMMAPIVAYPIYRWAGGKKKFFRWLRDM